MLLRYVLGLVALHLLGFGGWIVVELIVEAIVEVVVVVVFIFEGFLVC